jgi:hypothetical protein
MSKIHIHILVGALLMNIYCAPALAWKFPWQADSAGQSTTDKVDVSLHGTWISNTAVEQIRIVLSAEGRFDYVYRSPAESEHSQGHYQAGDGILIASPSDEAPIRYRYRFLKDGKLQLTDPDGEVMLLTRAGRPAAKSGAAPAKQSAGKKTAKKATSVAKAAPAVTGKKQASASADKRIFRYRHFEEPREKAFTVLVPKGWKTEGGIVSVPAHQVRTLVDGCGKKIHFSVYDPGSGARVEYFPFEMIHTSAPGSSYISLAPGQVLNGMVQMPQVLSPAEYIMQYGFSLARPNASNIKWGERQKMDKLARAWNKAFHSHDKVPVRSVAESVVVSYQLNGKQYKELWTGLFSYLTVATSTIWTMDFIVASRAPANKVQAFQPLLRTIANSFRVNSRWHAKAVAHYSACAEKVRLTQDQIRKIDRAIQNQRREVQKQMHKIDQEIADNRSATRATIQKHEHNTLMGLSEYEDPQTGKRANLDMGYERTFTNGTEIIQTNDWQFEPPPDYRSMKEIWNTDE